MSKIFIPVYLILIVISVSAVQFESFEVVRPEIEQLESDNNVFDYKFLPRPEEGLRDKRRLVVGMPNLLFMKEREPEPQLQRPSTRRFGIPKYDVNVYF